MEIIYRAAGIDDLDGIFELVKNAIEQMEHDNIHQWDSLYPAKDDFSNDIKKKELYVGTVNDEIAVIYALNKECDEQYRSGKWQYIGDDFRVIHRLCVSPKYQKKGIAHAVLQHIESKLRLLGVKAVWLDVFSENPYALRLYYNSGYQKVGVAHWRKGEFHLMEKLL